MYEYEYRQYVYEYEYEYRQYEYEYCQYMYEYEYEYEYRQYEYRQYVYEYRQFEYEYMYEYRQYVQPVNHNDHIQFECGKHFRLVGPSGSTCVNGQWSPPQLPTCQPRHHPHLYYLHSSLYLLAYLLPPLQRPIRRKTSSRGAGSAPTFLGHRLGSSRARVNDFRRQRVEFGVMRVYFFPFFAEEKTHLLK